MIRENVQSSNDSKIYWARFVTFICFAALLGTALSHIVGQRRFPIDTSVLSMTSLLITLLLSHVLLKNRSEFVEQKQVMADEKDELEQRVRRRTAALLKADQDLIAERKRLLDVLETLPAFVLLFTSDYKIKFSNKYFRQRFGAPNGSRCYEFLFNRTSPCEECKTLSVFDTKKPICWSWTGPDGREYDVYDFPFIDTDGTPLVVEMGMDVTEHRKNERALSERSEQLRALASELTFAEQRERRRLAELLHDDLQQLLVGAKFIMSPLIKSKDNAVKTTAEQVQELIHQSIDCSRSLTIELSPPLLHQEGLIPALEWLVDWMLKKYDLKVELSADAVNIESEDMKVLLFQSVKELLFNTVKHAGVKSAKLTIRRKGPEIEIIISDNGVGFDPVSLPKIMHGSGFGLISIRERLEHLGGKFNIESSDDGSRFTITAPLPG